MINVLRPDEITKILREQIENSNQGVMVQNRGTVLQVGDGIARVYGLDQVMSGELVKFEEETIGIALNLENDNVGVVLMDRASGKGMALRTGRSGPALKTKLDWHWSSLSAGVRNDESRMSGSSLALLPGVVAASGNSGNS
jgi:hypothetical protein